MSLIQNNNNYNWYYPELFIINPLDVNNCNENELTKKLVVSCDVMNVVESNKSSSSSQREVESDFGLKTLRSSQMNWGERSQKVESIQCRDCTYSTTNPISMNRHKLIHMYVTRFECSHCHHSFGDEHIFELHTKTHEKTKQSQDDKSNSSSSSSSSASSSPASSSSSCSQNHKKFTPASSSTSSKMPILTFKEGKNKKAENEKNKYKNNKSKRQTVKTKSRRKSNPGSIITVDLAEDDDDDQDKYREAEFENEDEEKRREREEIEEILHIFDDDSDDNYDSEVERKKKKKKKKTMRQTIKNRRPLSIKKKKKKRASSNSHSNNDNFTDNDNHIGNGNQNQDSNNVKSGNSSGGDDKALRLTTTRVHGKRWKVSSDSPFRYVCTSPGCNYGCQSNSRFKDHLINHSDQKNFKCNLCDSSFKRKYGLERHLVGVHHLLNQND